MNLKIILFPATLLSLTLSTSVLADHDGAAARLENSNRQSNSSSLRGNNQAADRHEFKKSKKNKYKKSKHKKDKHRDNDRYENRDRERKDFKRYDGDRYQDRDRDRYDGKGDRYEQQRYQEKYQNNPVGTVIERNVNDTKSKIDEAHRRAIETIDQKTRDFTGTNRPQSDRETSNPWWPFGSDSQ